jgi:hypothetical protein
MFNLNRSLADWREELRRGGACSPDDLEELEGHLREEMTRLAEAGLSSEEAFIVAARRLGRTDLLNGEYAKINAPRVWMHRSHWMAVGIFLYLVAAAAAAALQRVLMTGAAIASLNPYVFGVLSPLVNVAVMAMIAALVVLAVSRRAGHKRGILAGGAAVKLALVLGTLIWFTLLPLATWVAVNLGCNLVSPDAFGKLALAVYAGQFAFSVALPLAVAGWILKTRPSRC